MKKIFAFIMLVGLTGIIFAPLSVESYEVSPSVLKPGQEGYIKITLKNIQPAGSTTIGRSVEDINIYYTTASGMEFKTPSPIRVGTIEGGSTAIASFPVRILYDANGGVLSPSFIIKQKDGSEQIVVVPVIVINPAILVISLDKQTIKNTDVLNVTITNDGGKAGKMIIKLNNTAKFSFIGTDQIYVGDVVGSKNVLINLDARNADEGINILPLLVIYEEEGGSTQTTSKEISINVKKEKTDIIFTQMEPLVTSIDDILVLKLRNTGRTLLDFRLVLADETIQARESSEMKLGDFPAGEEKNVSMNIFANVQPGVRNVKIKLRWVEEDVQKEEDDTIPLRISSDADIGVFIDSKPVPLVVNGDHTLSVLVSNIGSYKIENVEIALQESDAIEILNPQKTQYIGGLESDDFSTVQYKIRVKKVQAGSYPLAITVRYKDQSGIWIEKNITSDVIIRVTDASGKRDGGNILFYLLGAVLVLAGGYWWYRKKKKEKQTMSK